MTYTPQPGDLLAGKYRLVRTLGAGGMGIVFEAQHELTDKRVAIKLLRPELSLRPLHVQRMLREAQASARIRHPNVVDVLDVGSEGDTFFLVMEYLEGETLGARLRRGPLVLSEALTLLMPAMRGVAAGHALGIVHRDIKPDNIFLARVRDQREPLPKVLDFGISKLLTGDDLSLTESGTTLGTPLYMSYEQLTGLRDVDAQSDVYAFGVILYEALTGRTPYRAETLGSLAVQLATTRPRRPAELIAALPPELDNIVMHALARDRHARFLSLELLLQALTPFVGHAHGTAHEAKPLADTATLPTVSVAALRPKLPSAPPAPRGQRRSRVIASAVGAMLVGAGLVLFRSVSERDAASKAALPPPSADGKVEAAPLAPQAPPPSSAHDASVAQSVPQASESAPAALKSAAASRRAKLTDTLSDVARRTRKADEGSAASTSPEKPAKPPVAASVSDKPNHRAGTPRLDEF